MQRTLASSRGILALFLVSIAFTIANSGLAAAPAIIPLPQQVQTAPGMFTLCATQQIPGAFQAASTRILVEPLLLDTANYLAALLFRSTGNHFEVSAVNVDSPVSGAIVLTTANAVTNLGAEGYELTVTPDHVLVRAPAPAGIFYGVQSFLQLLPPEIYAQRPVQGVRWMAPCVYIQDAPRFPWRGCMLDPVRHFFTIDEVKHFIDGMALLKLNRLHLHLSDDQGWRLQIFKYPLLTEVGAWRDGINWSQNPRSSTAWNTQGKYGGFYTQSEMREIVAYAQLRHIMVVPEIEMPGHSTAAASAYPHLFCDPNFAYDTDTDRNGQGVFCPARPETMPFLQDVLSEVLDIFPSPYIHIGGDEVKFSLTWQLHSLCQAKTNELGISSWPKYQAWFTQQIANWLHDRGRLMIGWSEIQNGGVLSNAACMDWLTGSSSKAVATATNRNQVIMTPTSICYLNRAEYTNATWWLEPPAQAGVVPISLLYNYEPIPAELPSEFHSYILGAESTLWSEWIPSAINLQFRAYPRLCALAELDWTPANLKNFNNFTNRVVTHKQRLDHLQINYNRGSIQNIGSWTPAETPASYATLHWDITSHIVSAGEVDVSFCYTSGANGLDIAWVALLENAVEIDRDSHPGFTGATPNNPRYVLHLPARRINATYTIQASVQGRGGTNSNGKVYLPNWN